MEVLICQGVYYIFYRELLLVMKKGTKCGIVSLKSLIRHQMVEGYFNRYDVLLRYLMAKAILTKVDYDYYKYYYLKMQSKTKTNPYTLEKHFQVFEEIVKNFDKDKFANQIAVTENFALIDGAHRLACYILFDIRELPIKKVSATGPVDYGKQKFKQLGFDQDILNKMTEVEKYILSKYK